MYISKNYIEIELASLKQKYQELLNNGNAISGAIQFAEHLLANLATVNGHSPDEEIELLASATNKE